MKNAIFFLRLSSVLMLAWWLGELWEWAEIALYGISQMSIVDSAAALLIASLLEKRILQGVMRCLS